MRALATAVTLVLLMGAVVGLQAVQERSSALHVPPPSGDALWVRSPDAMKRAVLSYRGIAADVYWIRAVQYFGSTALSTDPHKQFDRLFPLLDITTALDPDFTAAYRLGAIFLCEPFPRGPGRPDLAIDLLQKGLAAHPTEWVYAQDIGFVYYWWRQDYAQAADWFRRAGRMPKSPAWLDAVAAVTLTEGGNRESSRRLWQEMLESDVPGLQKAARLRLDQLDAMDQIDALTRVVQAYGARTGSPPRSWQALTAVGFLTGIPSDPAGYPYALDAGTGTVRLDPRSTLNPLPIIRSRRAVR